MSNQGYGPGSALIGTAFWLLAGAMFTFPFWGPVVGFLIGVGVSL